MKYILLMILSILFIMMTWKVQEGMKGKKDKKDKNKRDIEKIVKGAIKGSKKTGKNPEKISGFNDDFSYTYYILTNDDWNINRRTIQGILEDKSQERCLVLYPIGTDPKKIFSFMDEQYPPTGSRIRLVLLYNSQIGILSPILNMLDVFATSELKQSLFLYAKGSDTITQKVGNIVPL